MALRGAEAMLIAANAHLQEKQAALKAVVEKVAALEKALAAVEAEQASLKQQANVTAVRLQRAAKLTNGLQEEGVRWGKSAHQIKVRGKLGGITARHGLGSSVLRAELTCREIAGRKVKCGRMHARMPIS